MTTPDVLFIVVAYERPDLVRGLLSTLQAQSDDSWAGIVVDNSELEHRVSDAVGLDDERVVYLASGRNRGYLPAADYALRNYLGSAPLPQWIVISNQDIQLLPNFVAMLRGCACNPRGCHILAPAVRDSSSGALANPYLISRPSVLKQFAVALMSSTDFTYAFLERAFQRREESRAELRGAGEVEDMYAAHGSLMCLSAGFFRHGGSLSYPGRLFGEEVYLAEQVRAMRGSVKYAPSLHAVHFSHATTGRGESRKPSRLVRRERRSGSWRIVRMLTWSRQP